VDGIGRRIVAGTLKPGDDIGEAASLTAGIPVSRTVTREATKVLAAKGLVDPRPKVGTRVLPREFWNLLDPDVLAWSLEVDGSSVRYGEIYEVRSIIEPRVASLAAARRTGDEAALLGDLQGRLAAAVDDVDAFVAVDLELHDAILIAAHNAILAQLAGTIRLVWNACQRLSALAPGSRVRAVEEHRAVIDAICALDGTRAASATEILIARAAVDLEAVLASQPLPRGTPGAGEG
jgi:GntR family transcriptional regulator, galactonate operon transcriptional repressor